jgi:hypothetical protein
MFIKPLENKKIPDPVRGGFLPEEGANVDEHDIYWQRRINDNDVKIAKPEKLAPKV